MWKNAIRLVVNWLVILAFPLWIVPYGAYALIVQLKEKNPETIDSLLLGKYWIWD